MKSTGEVMGTGDSFDEAGFAKARCGRAGDDCRKIGRIYLRARCRDKPRMSAIAKSLIDMGFTLLGDTVVRVSTLHNMGLRVSA